MANDVASDKYDQYGWKKSSFASRIMQLASKTEMNHEVKVELNKSKHVYSIGSSASSSC